MRRDVTAGPLCALRGFPHFAFVSISFLMCTLMWESSRVLFGMERAWNARLATSFRDSVSLKEWLVELLTAKPLAWNNMVRFVECAALAPGTERGTLFSM